MNKKDMAITSAKVAEYCLNNGYTFDTIKNLSKSDIVKDFPELDELIVVSEKAYDNFKEETTFNYFKASVEFDFVYLSRTTHGGKREGAGRKSPGYKTEVFTARVPVDVLAKVKEAVDQIVSDFKGGV